ncbi:IS630 family transposase [Streptomyces marianii]|uniref:IS630 family transposase n=1 Tax=Streptomyces marianii TaxID=1817406 RepID=UPI00148670AB|nr:IS630 family transposase [Streptomyces marianii]
MTPAGREVVRLRVVAALESGQVKGYRQAAGMCQVAERSVGTWWRAYQAGGREAPAVRRTGRPGPGERIGPEERAVVFQAMADYIPEELLIGGPLWTRPLVAELVRMVTGVVMTEHGVGKWLRRQGFSPQRPDRRSYRQDQAKVDAWLEGEYPRIVARTKEEDAVVAWADQCGLRSDTAPPGTSWAPKGQTPVVKVSGRRFKVNIMSAIAGRGTVYFTVFTEKFTARVFTAFLDRLARQASRKVHVIADRHPVHRSKAATASRLSAASTRMPDRRGASLFAKIISLRKPQSDRKPVREHHRSRSVASNFRIFNGLIKKQCEPAETGSRGTGQRASDTAK